MRSCFAIIVFGLLSGCWYAQVTNGMVSTRDIEFGKSDKTYRIDKLRKVCGADRVHIICVIPTGDVSPQEAIDNTLDQVRRSQPIVGLADAQVSRQYFYIPYIYGQLWYAAEGYPIYEITKQPEPVAPVVREKPVEAQSPRIVQPKPIQKKESRNSFEDLPF